MDDATSPNPVRPTLRLWPSDDSMKHICKSIEKVIIAAFTTKNTVPFGLLMALCFLIWKLPAPTIESLILRVIDSRWFAVLGWVLLGVVLLGAWRLFCWRERLHVAELDQIIKVRDRLVEEQLKLKLNNGPLELENP
jgi:hypothetical protein